MAMRRAEREFRLLLPEIAYHYSGFTVLTTIQPAQKTHHVKSAFLLQLTSAILASEPGRYNQLLQKQVSDYIRREPIPGQQCVSRLPFAQIGPAVQRLCCRLAQNR